MNSIKFLFVFLASAALFGGCNPTTEQPPVSSDKKILVDATKDGGVWWSPQSGARGFSANTEHQGKKLADHLRSLGYQVDELPRGGIVTWSVLKEYNKVIRAWSLGDYSAEEISAYDSFLNRPSSLMLGSEYLGGYQQDNLSEHLGLKLGGAVEGSISQFNAHPITEGVSSINFIMGSAVTNIYKNDNITVLGWLNNDAPVMGILHYQQSKIFFIGDINGLEQLPQPFVNNLVNWLY